MFERFSVAFNLNFEDLEVSLYTSSLSQCPLELGRKTHAATHTHAQCSYAFLSLLISLNYGFFMAACGIWHFVSPFCACIYTITSMTIIVCSV